MTTNVSNTPTRWDLVKTLPEATWEAGKNDIIKGATGIYATARSLLAFGTSQYWNRKSENRLNNVLATTFILPILGTMIIKPNFDQELTPEEDDSLLPAGWLSRNVAGSIFKAACNAANTDASSKRSSLKAWFTKHVVARIEFAAAGLVATATRIVDFAVGLAAFAMSPIALLFGVNKVSLFAISQLSITQVLKDISLSLRGLENPSQFRTHLPARQPMPRPTPNQAPVVTNNSEEGNNSEIANAVPIPPNIEDSVMDNDPERDSPEPIDNAT